MDQDELPLHHITLSSSILEELVEDYIERKLGKEIVKSKWICDEDYGFAGYRIYFEMGDGSEK